MPPRFSRGGNEVAFGTIGNASCAEGHFWEAINAIGVLGAPVVLSLWDDGYGISVTNEHQLAKPDLTELLEGFRRQRHTCRVDRCTAQQAVLQLEIEPKAAVHFQQDLDGLCHDLRADIVPRQDQYFPCHSRCGSRYLMTSNNQGERWRRPCS